MDALLENTENEERYNEMDSLILGETSAKNKRYDAIETLMSTVNNDNRESGDHVLYRKNGSIEISITPKHIGIGDVKVRRYNWVLSSLNGFVSTFCAFKCSNRTENIVSFVWVISLFFVGVTFTVAQYNSNVNKFLYTSHYWVLFLFLIISIIGMSIAIFYRNNKKLATFEIKIEDEAKKWGYISTKYLISCAYIFAIGNLLLDMFSIVSAFHCGFSVKSLTDKSHYKIQFLFHIARVSYISIQLLFVQIFYGAKIKQSFQFLFKLLILQMISTNVCIWFAFLCQETYIDRTAHSTQRLDTKEYSFNCSLSFKNDIFNIASSITIYLQPFVLEYALLLSLVLFFMYPFKAISKNHSTQKNSDYDLIDSVKTDDSKFYKSDPGVFIGIIVSTTVLLSSWSVQFNFDFLENLLFKYSAEITIHLLITVASICVMKEIFKYHIKVIGDRKYKVEDYLLLITGLMGYLPFFIAVIFSVTKKIEYKNDQFPIPVADNILSHEFLIRILLCVLAVMNVFGVLVQMYFLITCSFYKRVSLTDTSYSLALDISRQKIISNKLCSSARIGQWLMFLFVLNAALWINDTLFGVPYMFQRVYWISEHYWGENVWLFMYKLFYPLLIFYRLHSAAMVALLWKKFRVKRNNMN